MPKMTHDEYDALILGHDASFVKIFLDRFYEEDRELLHKEIEESGADEEKVREGCYIKLKYLTIFYEYIMSKIMTAENIRLAVNVREDAAKVELEGDNVLL